MLSRRHQDLLRSTATAVLAAGCVALLTASTAAAVPAPAPAPAEEAAAEEEEKEAPPPSPSRWSAGFGIGYGHSLQFPRHADGLDVTDLQMLIIQSQLRYRLFEWGQPGHLGRSDFDFMVEGQLAVNFVPDTGAGGGVTGGFRNTFMPDRKWSPYLLGLAGVGGIDYGLQNQDDGWQFWLQAGVGLRRTLRGRTGLTLEVRYHHISNLGLHLPNAGIDSIVTAVGVDF